jgi:porin
MIGVGAVAAAEPDHEAAKEVVGEDVRLEEEAPAGSKSLRTLDALAGEWGGWRNALAERGLTLGLAHTSDVMGIVRGGVHRRAEFLGDWDLTLAIETEPLLGWRGGSVFVYGLGLWSTGSPSENAGDIQTLDNIDAPEEWKLYEAWVQQELLGGRLSLLAGLYDLNGEFDVIDTATLFLNSSFGVGKDFSQSGETGPSIFPTTAVGVRLDTQPVAGGYARIAVLDGVADDADGSRMIPALFAFNSEDGVLCVGEMGYVAGREERGGDPYTKVGLGGWFYSAEFDRVGGVDADRRNRRQEGNYGVYLLGERLVYREPQAPERGLAAFVRVGFADSEVNPIGFYVGGGAAYTGLISVRPDDRLGLGAMPVT